MAGKSTVQGKRRGRARARGRVSFLGLRKRDGAGVISFSHSSQRMEGKYNVLTCFVGGDNILERQGAHRSTLLHCFFFIFPFCNSLLTFVVTNSVLSLSGGDAAKLTLLILIIYIDISSTFFVQYSYDN